MTPEERADLAESMVPIACDLACRVRDADAGHIARLAESRGWDAGTAALVVVLAAMVPDDARVGDLLAWTDGIGVIMAWQQEPLPLIPRCGKPVAAYKVASVPGETLPCGRPAGHGGQCYSEAAWRRKLDANAAGVRAARERDRRPAAEDAGQRQGEAA